jgi:broad specificity phosphatase PhoE
MKQLYFTRHAEQQRRTGGRSTHTAQGALTDVGKWHASAAGLDARTRGLDFDLIMSSPLPHALHTARIIAEELDYNPKHIETSDLLLGFGWSRPQHLAPGHIITPSQELHFQPDNADAKETLKARTAKILTYLQERPEAVILLVGHSAFGQTLQHLLGKELLAEDYRDNELPHARILQLI